MKWTDADIACAGFLQPIVGQANPSIVEPLLNLLRTLHLEVQFEGMASLHGFAAIWHQYLPLRIYIMFFF